MQATVVHAIAKAEKTMIQMQVQRLSQCAISLSYIKFAGAECALVVAEAALSFFVAAEWCHKGGH